MARVYASSPELHPADQTRIGSSAPLPSMILGITSLWRYSHAGRSRKKLVTLMRMVLKRMPNSSACTSR